MYVRNISSVLIGVALIFSGCQSSDGDLNANQVEILLEADGLNPGDTVYITGSSDELCNWDPALVPMKMNEDGQWRAIVSRPSDENTEYKFTLGKWSLEALDSNDRPFPNHILTPDQDLAFHQVGSWKKKKTFGSQPRLALGQIDLGEMESKGILPRNVAVWLPPNYSSSEEEYPVLYMHDGQNIFEAGESYSGVEWGMDETCDTLMRTGQIPPMIVVALDNTKNRSDEYGPGTMGNKYIEFIINVVKPEIDDMFRTKSSAEYTYTGGSSMGGLISFRAVWEYPQVFSRAICMSPAFVYQGNDYVEQIQNTPTPKPKPTIYIDNGGIGLESKLQPGCDIMLSHLNRAGLIQDVDYFWVMDPNAEHDEAAWAQRLPNALKIIANSPTP